MADARHAAECGHSPEDAARDAVLSQAYRRHIVLVLGLQHRRLQESSGRDGGCTSQAGTM